MNFNELKFVLNNVKTIEPFTLTYGTAGFRSSADKLKGVAIRLGIAACARSISLVSLLCDYLLKLKDFHPVGVMITASHNPPLDNGMKLVDPDGSMLAAEWESVVLELMKWPPDDVPRWLSQRCQTFEDTNSNKRPCVLLGYDTRESSPLMAKELTEGIKLMNGICIDMGLVTTPQLHYGVQYVNSKLDSYGTLIQPLDLDSIYMEKFAYRFRNALTNLPAQAPNRIELYVDCAHGVGALALNKLSNYLTSSDDSRQLQLHLVNTNTECKKLLNNQCGADYVKVSMCAPEVEGLQLSDYRSARWASIDGDADRLIYFQFPSPTAAGDVGETRIVQLLDGDRIACLFASFITKLLDSLNYRNNLTVGVVQTAYANNSSTLFLEKELKASVVCVPTGVKHLHRAAHDFDFGIYFEANGHGTVLFSKPAINFINSLDTNNPLSVFLGLTNTAIGDAITDILMVEYCLAWHNWSLSDWASMYTDLPSRQLKLPVKNPQIIRTTNAERTVSDPRSLQEAIDQTVASVNEATGQPGLSRCFVRPSGTENIVRIYAESLTRELVDWLAIKVAIHTHRLIHGTGPEPSDPGSIPIPKL